MYYINTYYIYSHDIYVYSVIDAHLQHIAEHGVLGTGDVSYPEGITS